MTLCTQPSLSRRAIIGSAGALFAWSSIPAFARDNSGRDPRFVVIVLRGALDGLSAVAPVGDPDYAGLHGALALSTTGDRPALPLDSFFALNPGMPGFAKLFAAKQAAVVHAVATPYRERSHFDGQDVLESGMSGPGSVQSGWLNRALAALPARERVATREKGLGVGAIPPLVIRGPAPVLGWTPQNLPAADDDVSTRLLDLYRQSDPALGEALSAGLQTDRVAARQMMGPRGADNIAGMKQAAEGAARLLAADDGPRIAALAFDGWDTHANEGGGSGRLAQLLSGLDGAIDAFRMALGPAWRDTVIFAVTEFGRTARINGTVGTDHGTGSVAFLAGGAVAGGRVIADWPSLALANLYEGRDLRPTVDLRAVMKGVMADHLGLGAGVLALSVFPDSASVRPMSGLIV